MYSTPKNATFYSWKAEPYTRGTSSILTSCFITLTLCVWTAVHLNIPKYRKTTQATWRKVAWLFTAMLAPELVALVAFCQWRESSKLSQYVRQVYGLKAEPSWRVPKLFQRKGRKKIGKGERNDLENVGLNSSSTSGKRQRHPWTRTHSFYALMGGFALETRSLEQNIFSYNRHRMILSADGFKFLLQHEPDMLPDLSQAEIFDKSKASNLAKTVVCCQAVWFCAQCIARWHSGLAFSLLELNTFAHCVCALIIFTLWWDKPLDVEEPTLINVEPITELAAVMSIASCARSSREEYKAHPRLGLGGFGSDISTSTAVDHRSVLSQNQRYQGFEYLGPCKLHDDTPRQVVRRGKAPTEHVHRITLEKTDKHCWRLASKGIEKYIPDRDSVARGEFLPFLDDCTKRMLVDRVGDVPHANTLSRTVVLATLAIAGFLYGGVHLAAWRTVFKTRAEEQLWKISAITLAASGPLGIPVIILQRAWRGSGIMSCGNFMISMVLLWAVPAGIVLYLVARVYLIVESFVNLTYLEESTFLVPNWLQYIPHIT